MNIKEIKNKDFLLYILENLQNGVLIAKGDIEKCNLEIIYVNKTLCDIYGYTKKEIMDENISILGLQNKNQKNEIQKCLKKNNSFVGEIINKRKNNSFINFLLSIHVFVLDKTKYFIALYQDIESKTKLMKQIDKQYEELELKNQELEYLIYSISHDLKSPLFTIEGFVNVVKDKLKNSNVKEEMNEISNAIKKLSDIIQKTLEFSRLGRIYKDLTFISTREILNHIIGLHKHFLDNRDVEIICNNHIKFYAQREMVISLFQNLISNSIQHGKIDGKQLTINIDLKKEDNYIYINYKDNGKGIPKKYHKNLFEPYKRPFAKGIGLMLIKKSVEFHKGKINTYENSNKELVFNIVLKDLNEL